MYRLLNTDFFNKRVTLLVRIDLRSSRRKLEHVNSPSSFWVIWCVKAAAQFQDFLKLQCISGDTDDGYIQYLVNLLWVTARGDPTCFAGLILGRKSELSKFMSNDTTTVWWTYSAMSRYKVIKLQTRESARAALQVGWWQTGTTHPWKAE